MSSDGRRALDLSVLAAAFPGATVEGSAAVSGVTLDSRRVSAGDLYAALPGSRHHGADFVRAAADHGAVAVLTDPSGRDRVRAAGLPVLVVDDPRSVLGDVASEVYGRPSDALTLVGVTGTQGKTTTTRLIEGAWLDLGVPAGVIGTIGTRIVGEEVATALTTPEAPDLHRLFGQMRDRGVTACAMEVSSHALVMGRVDGVVFDVAGFTNLGRDHLDFHADLEDYFAAKASLFTPERARRAVVVVDDEYGRRLAEQTDLPVRTVSLSDPGADWFADALRPFPGGTRYSYRGPGGVSGIAEVRLPGEFNVANALLALACLAETGQPAAAAAEALGRAGDVPGRMERVDAGQDFLAVVDYAHKPEALSAALDALRGGTPGLLILVVGAGGDRDAGKREIMGRLAARGADVVIVTDDNPRSEEPAAIREALLAGARGEVSAAASRVRVEEIGDRREAIRRAVALASPGDTVLVAGKGHEKGQEVDGVVYPFDDRIVLREELGRR